MKKVIVLLCLSVIAGCSSTDISNPGDIVFPATNVSFKRDLLPYFTLSCNAAGCHDAARSDNYDVDLTYWPRVASRVAKPYDTTCALIMVIYGREMHFGGFTINDNQREGIRQWIMEGARDN